MESVNKLISLNGLSVFKAQLENQLGISYSSSTKRISIMLGSKELSYMDASSFLIDGMVNNVTVVNKNAQNQDGTFMKFEFNTDAGKSDIYINVADLLKDIPARITALETDMGTKVNKIPGKGLSENNFTNAYKTVLDDLITKLQAGKDLSDYNYDELAKAFVDDMSAAIESGEVALLNSNEKLQLLDMYTLVSNAIKQGKNFSDNNYTDDEQAFLNSLKTAMEAATNPKVLSSNDFTDAHKTAVDTVIAQQAQGKGLSKNDFTNDYKEMLDNIATNDEVLMLFEVV